MLTELQIILITDCLELSSDSAQTVLAAYDYTITKVSETYLDDALEVLLENLDPNNSQGYIGKRDTLLAKNQTRLKKASTLEWDVSSGISSTGDVDKLITNAQMRLYRLLNLGRFNVSMNFLNHDRSITTPKITF